MKSFDSVAEFSKNPDFEYVLTDQTFFDENDIDNLPLLLYSNPVQVEGENMTIQTTYTQARASLARLLDEVTHNQQIVIIQRRGEEDVAIVSANELESLLETAHLLRSPKNAERLISALGRALHEEKPSYTLADLHRDVGYESKDA